MMKDTILGVCVMCKKRITEDKEKVREIDGLWLCGSGCANKLLKEKKQWTPAGWHELCQLLYEEYRWVGGKTS